MIYFTVKQKKFYDRISVTSTLDIVEDIRHCASPLFHWPYVAYDSGKLREGAEYKLLQLIFLQEYALPKGFDFSAYMQQALDENITETIQVSTSTAVYRMYVCICSTVSSTQYAYSAHY
jgi:hypothetical protein